MKITRCAGNYKTTWEIDFSRELSFYELNVPMVEHGIGVPVIPTRSSPRNETYFWDSNYCVEVTVGDDRYMLDDANPKEYARLVNNLETLFALHGLG